MDTFFKIFWPTILVIAGVVEAIAIKRKAPGDTLSEQVRNWFQIKHKSGLAIWLAAWGGFAVWFLVHIGFSAV
jgi:hypothetical protein